ncbi:hypothetical protein ASE17_08760 [Phenylobacterium sp. Root77]|jgi:hypothetical protein|uniref:hypothetical protein n=1 Tax=unclassified Phenylobacterium TaxID=2640670 RepID=UPI0006F6F138|nr:MULTISPECIES: hypothetical protein [unclassified Phenylobacterium]KQW73034.1 hypothetical protein ASC73_01330 [Phenylobacterium sp. Root1277]KQW92254.1 hypothetical protein ASC79_12040 [Phenylobacterium sp. Root1290]KRC40485.1 hypothetical protein ASE17_08760 [Phenylobacterium sp. Root77]
MVTYAARLSPLQGETVWTLEKSAIVERRTGRERRFPLAELRGVTRAGRGAVLQFQRRRVTIPALTYGGAMRPLDQTDTFEAFLAALSDAVPDRPIRRPSPNVEAVLWIMGLMAVGAAAVLFAAGVAGAWLLGVALAARLVFVVILGAAVLPWLRPRAR